MRDILNGILVFIGAESLTDEEWNSLDIDDGADQEAQFNALKFILSSREAVSDMYRRLTCYFKAKGMVFGEESNSEIGSSNIFLGSVL